MSNHEEQCCCGTQGVMIGQPAPEFTVDALVGKEFKTINLSDYKDKWVVLFFYPLDFTFVCPTEIIEFSNRASEFESRKCQVLGGSTDSKFSHLGWVNRSSGIERFKNPSHRRLYQTNRL